MFFQNVFFSTESTLSGPIFLSDAEYHVQRAADHASLEGKRILLTFHECKLVKVTKHYKIEWFLIQCRKTKTKLITLTNHKIKT